MDFRITNYFAEFFMNILKLHPQKSGRYVVKAYLPQIKFTISQQSVHFAFPDFTIWDKKTARLPIEPCCSNDRYTSRNIKIKTPLLAFIDALLKRSAPALSFFDGRFPCRLFSTPRKAAASTDDDRQPDNNTCKIPSRGKAAHSSTSTLF